MRLEIANVDCTAAVSESRLPRVTLPMLELRRPQIWCYSEKPIILDGQTPPEWTLAPTDTEVRVPLVPYRSTDFELSTLVGSGLIIGLQALEFLPSGLRAEALHLLLGNVWRVDDDLPGYQYWLGFALHVVQG